VPLNTREITRFSHLGWNSPENSYSSRYFYL